MAFKMKGPSLLKMTSAFKQNRFDVIKDPEFKEGPTSVVEATTSEGITYPMVRELGDEEYSEIFKTLPGSVFKGGTNTGDVLDVDADKYSRFLSSLTKGDE